MREHTLTHCSPHVSFHYLHTKIMLDDWAERQLKTTPWLTHLIADEKYSWLNKSVLVGDLNERDHHVGLSPLSNPAVSANATSKKERTNGRQTEEDNRGGLIRVSVTDSVVNKPAINWRPPQLKVIVSGSLCFLWIHGETPSALGQFRKEREETGWSGSATKQQRVTKIFAGRMKLDTW